MTEKMIIDAWAEIRKTNQSIPDDVLDFMKDASLEKLNNVGKDHFLKGVEFGISQQVREDGYAGMLPNGNLVDRRKFPEATPLQENRLLGIPKPKALD